MSQALPNHFTPCLAVAVRVPRDDYRIVAAIRIHFGLLNERHHVGRTLPPLGILRYFSSQDFLDSPKTQRRQLAGSPAVMSVL